MISFEMPEQLGTILHIDGQTYPMFDRNCRLTDKFLDEMITQNAADSFSYVLLDSNEKDADSVSITCNKNSTSITYKGKKNTFPVSKKDFCDAFYANVKKYAIYWAAPCNYPAIMMDSFDNMVKKMETYRPASNEILKKLEKLKD